jgi:hypothetical protein
MWKKKHGEAGKATDKNTIPRMRFAYRITKSYRHKLIVHNSYPFSTATMVTRKHLSVTSYVQGGSNMTGTDCVTVSPGHV